jgi:AcrR family transcriptional regulator
MAEDGMRSSRKPAVRRRSKTSRRGADQGARPDAGAKAQILQAALDLFARDGFDGASMPKIAQAANVGHPLIHYHFGSKDNLWREAVAHSIGGIVSEGAVLDMASQGLPAVDRLKMLIRSFTLFSARYPSHLAILMFEIRVRGERFDWLMRNYLRPFVTRWHDVLTAAEREGAIKHFPIGNLTMILTASVTNYFSINVHEAKGRDVDALAKEHADYVIDVLLDGMLLSPRP